MILTFFLKVLGHIGLLGKGKLNRKAQVALGETELAHRHTNSSKLIDFAFPKRIAVSPLLQL